MAANIRVIYRFLGAFGRLLLALLVTTLACSIPGAPVPTAAPATQEAIAPTPVGGAADVAPPFSGEAVGGAAERLPTLNPFGPFVGVTASAPDPGLPRDELQDLQKLESLQLLTASQQETLLANGFVIDPQPFESFAAAYAYAGEQKLPAFISADAILHTFHIVTDVAWQRSQALYLQADLEALTQAMVAESQNQWETAQDDETARAALRNMAFFAVARSMLDPGFEAPPPVAAVVAEELTLVAQGGRFISPLYGSEEDYSRFDANDGYAPDESFARYLQALTWLSRPLSLDYGEAGSAASQQLAEARLAARQVLLITWGLETSNNLSRWERIYQPSLYFQGTRVAWGLPQVQAAAAALYGAAPASGDLADEALLDDFIATILSMPPSLPFQPSPQPAFALLQAPSSGPDVATPDADILRRLVFNRVGAYMGESPPPRTAVETNIGVIRGLPRTLDVPAVLGSQLAQAIVAAEGDDAYDGYTLQLQQLQQYFAALPQASWTTSFDGGWLLALQPLLAPLPESGFLYAPAASWQREQLNTWHAAWTTMRYTTALVPQPVSDAAIVPEIAYGFLEPQPLLYGRLSALAGQVLEGLGSRGLLDDESADKLGQLERLMDAARTISRKELAGQHLTEDEAQLLSQFISRLDGLTTYQPAAGETVTQTDPGLARLVDVALEPSSGRLLQAATGEAWAIYVLVPREEDILLAMGAVLSSFELHGEQVGPGAWRDMESRPPAPDWLAPLMATE